MDVVEERIGKEIWGGSVPVIFNLAPHEVTAMEPPLSYCTLLPRMSYLPLVTKDARAHFLPSAPAMEDEMWFEHNSMPLKWNLPIGVLFDLHNLDETVPMEITVHFQLFPEKSLLRCRNLATVRAAFTNSFKECCYLQYGTVQAASSLSKGEHEELWNAVLKSDGAAHALLVARLDASFRGASDRSRLPVRIIMNGFGDAVNYDRRVIQRPALPVDADGAPQTLGGVLRTVLPGVVFDGADLVPGVQVLIQGMCVPLLTPLAWLCNNCRHPDLFLYVCVTKRGK